VVSEKKKEEGKTFSTLARHDSSEFESTRKVLKRGKGGRKDP